MDLKNNKAGSAFDGQFWEVIMLHGNALETVEMMVGENEAFKAASWIQQKVHWSPGKKGGGHWQF